MKKFVPLLGAVVMSLSTPASAQNVVGDWNGRLGEGPGALRVVIHILAGSNGELTGTIDSPDQNARGIALADIEAGVGKLVFTVPMIQGKYQAEWDETGQRWRGIWEQNAGPTPLDLASGSLPPPPLPPADWGAPHDEAIGALLETRNAARSGQGIVVGLIEPEGTRIVGRGPEGGAAFDRATVFEIGSISKVFTALILADMANRGEVSLDDPAERYLPVGHRMPARGRKITLADLSAHMSGLPRLPDNLRMMDPDDPYADYTEARMLAFLDSYALPRDVGATWEYSNLGAGLLGYLLGRAAGSDYSTLLRERITGPLGMTDTWVTLSPAREARLAPPLDMYLRPAKPWNLSILAGAGGIRSSTADMLEFAAAALDPHSPIAAAMATALARRTETGDPRVEQALGWQVGEISDGREMILHNGGTGGFRAALALEPARGRAAVVLVNSAAEPSATDLALHVLIGAPVAATPPVPPVPDVRTEVSLPAEELDRVVGRYDFGAGIVFDVTREGKALRAQRAGAQTGPVLPIFAEGPLRFFYRAVDGQIRFLADENGQVTGAVFTQGGQELQGRRVRP